MKANLNLNIDSAELKSWLKEIKSKTVAIVIGHEPGAGAVGEREYQKVVAEYMVEIFDVWGVKVWLYEHGQIRDYGDRIDAMSEAMSKEAPEAFICYELHYNAYNPKPEANGHEFLFNKAELLAQCHVDVFQDMFPDSTPRTGGLKHTPSGNGAGFLRETTGWAILPEPFFITNPTEKEFFKDKHHLIAISYCLASAKFAYLASR